MDLQLDQALTRDVGNGAAMRFADNEEAFAYVCGFIARRHKPKDCSLCYKSIIGDGDENYNAFIILRSRGHLTFPSVDLIRLLQEVEVIISDCLKATIKRNTLLEILFKIQQHKIHSLVGCPEHEKTLTKSQSQECVFLAKKRLENELPPQQNQNGTQSLQNLFNFTNCTYQFLLKNNILFNFLIVPLNI
jgi:hypothetical protein